MDNWRSHMYCLECKRPFVESTEKQVEVLTQGGIKEMTVYNCIQCDRRLRLGSGFTLARFLAFASIVLSLVTFPIALQANERDWWIGFGLAIVLAVTLTCVYLELLMRCKPIYDRWVMQHGTDPDKWPAPAKPE